MERNKFNCPPRDGDFFRLVHSAQGIIDDCDVNLVEKLNELMDRVEKIPTKLIIARIKWLYRRLFFISKPLIY